MQGIDKKTLQPDMHWRYDWPQGIDDGTDDDKIMNWFKEPKEGPPVLKYDTKMRQW